MNEEAAENLPSWFPAPEGRLIGPGHPAGDFLEAYDWTVLAHEAGRYRIEAHQPSHVRSRRGYLFGGFTPTYVDLLAVRTAHSVLPERFGHVLTVNMRIDYIAPVVDERFILESRVIHTRGRSHLVEVLFKDLRDELLVFSITALRQRG